jgi:hypothetical protein
MPDLDTLQTYSEPPSARVDNLRFIRLMSLMGLGSGVITLPVAAGLGGFAILGLPFAAVVTCSLAITGIVREVWKGMFVLIAISATFYASLWLTVFVELSLPWKSWGDMGASPNVSPVSLFVGGMTGGFLVMATVFLVAYPEIHQSRRILKALGWSFIPGALTVTGWYLGSTRLLAPRQHLGEGNQTANWCSLLVLWQSGMGLLLGVLLRSSQERFAAREARPTHEQE